MPNEDNTFRLENMDKLNGPQILGKREMGTDSRLKTSARKVLEQFQALPEDQKKAVTAVIIIIGIASAGKVTWGAISWLWPRLLRLVDILNHADSPKFQRHFKFLVSGLNSASWAFQNFMVSWEAGKPLMACLEAFTDTDLIWTATGMTSEIMSHFFHFQRVVQSKL